MNAREPTKSTATEVIKVVAGVLRRQDRVLICQRAAGGRQGLKWEFPGGKIEAGETDVAALARELEEELGLRLDAAAIGPLLARQRHRYRDFEVELAFYEVTAGFEEPVNRVFASMVWELPQRLGEYDFLEADRPLLAILRDTPPPESCGVRP